MAKRGRPTKYEQAETQDAILDRWLRSNDKFVWNLEEADTFYRFITEKPMLLKLLYDRGFKVSYHYLGKEVGLWDVKILKPTSLIQK